MTAWLEERRQQAAESNEVLSLPSSSDEHWRFTSLRGIDFATFGATVEAVPGEPQGAILAEGEHAGRIVMRDGGVVLDEFSPEVAAQGVVFGSLKRLAEEHSNLVEPVLGTIVGASACAAASTRRQK